MTLYAAYGSNLDPRRMAQRAPSSPVRGSGWLRGWRLTFAGEELGWDGSLSTVVEDAQASVFVMLYEMTAQDERALDAWEGVELGLWTKIKVRVQTMGRQELAWIYVLDAYEGGLPSAHYLGVLAEAAEAGGALAEYVERLRLLPCRSIDGTDYSAD